MVTSMVSSICEITEEEFDRTTKEAILLPIGSIEPHGKHLPLGTDIILAQAIANGVSDRTGWPTLPVMSYGFIYGLREFPGAISVPEEILRLLILNLGAEVKRSNFKILAIINCHNPNNPSISQASFKLLSRLQLKTLNLTFPGLEEAYHKYCESELWKPGIFHADELETSMMLYLRPDLVKLSLAERNYPKPPTTFGFHPHSWSDFSKISVIGDPTKASEEKGRLLFRFFVNRIIELVRDLLDSV